MKTNAAKRLVEDSSDVVPFLKKEDSFEGLMHHTAMHENVFHERDVKRQKKLSYGLPEMALQSHDHNQQRESCSRIIANSDCNLTCKLSESSFVAHPQEVSDQHLLEGSACAFCLKSKITEVRFLLYILKDKLKIEFIDGLQYLVLIERKKVFEVDKECLKLKNIFQSWFYCVCMWISLEK